MQPPSPKSKRTFDTEIHTWKNLDIRLTTYHYSSYCARFRFIATRTSAIEGKKTFPLNTFHTKTASTCLLFLLTLFKHAYEVVKSGFSWGISTWGFFITGAMVLKFLCFGVDSFCFCVGGIGWSGSVGTVWVFEYSVPFSIGSNSQFVWIKAKLRVFSPPSSIADTFPSVFP